MLVSLCVWCCHHYPLQSLGFLQLVHLGLSLPVRPLWRTILFGEGLELKRVKGVFTTSHILHCVLSPAALTVEKQKLCIIYFWQMCDYPNELFMERL